jgi:hypothetical protein
MAMDALKKLWLPEHRWKTLTVGWFVVAGLGLWGMLASSPPDMGFLDMIYKLPDFFTFDIPGVLANETWQLQVARWLGPVVAAAAFFQATAILFKEQFDLWRITRAKDHTIVVGLGEKGSRIATDFVRQGRNVVAIERDATAPRIDQAKAAGVKVLIGDASDPDLLLRARVRHATDLISLCGADGDNVEVAAVARRVHDDDDGPMLCTVHLLDGQLCSLLRLEELRGLESGVRLDFMNTYQRGARLWLNQTTPLEPQADGSPPHLVVIGLDELAEALVVSALQRWGDREDPPRLPMTIVDPDANRRLGAIRLNNPMLDTLGDLTAVDLDFTLADQAAVDGFTARMREGSPTAVYVCVADETAALSIGLTVQRLLAPRDVPIHVRTDSEKGITLLLQESAAATNISPLKGFGLYDRTCTAVAVNGGTLEVVARSMHQDYLRRVRASGDGGALAVEWDELPAEGRESNRLAAAQITTGLSRVGCALVPLYHWDGRGFAFTDDQLDTLARLEHERWMAERTAAGWSYGEVRDDAKKENPLLRPWDELPEAARDQNRDGIRALPVMLARAGFEIVQIA